MDDLTLNLGRVFGGWNSPMIRRDRIPIILMSKTTVGRLTLTKMSSRDELRPLPKVPLQNYEHANGVQRTHHESQPVWLWPHVTVPSHSTQEEDQNCCGDVILQKDNLHQSTLGKWRPSSRSFLKKIKKNHMRQAVPPAPGRHYRGSIIGSPASAFLSFIHDAANDGNVCPWNPS